jgi:tetratricopeptide (TPR) repeat protein
MRRAILLALLLAGSASPSLWAQPDPDRLKSAKALFFDRKYAEARQAWQRILAASRGAEADIAAYWVARSSENLGEDERALKEYADFLRRRPADRALAEEARTSRVSLAARLYKAGQKQHLPILREALVDSSKTVRYFAALQLSTLGPEAGREAVPVLQRIVQDETDADLVDRATVGLLRLDPQSLPRTPRVPAVPSTPRTIGGEARWLKVRIFEKGGGSKPKVVVNLPVALADMVFKSLPDDAKRELKLKGYDADNFWERLKILGPAQIIDIEGDEGEKIQIWIE